MLTLATVLLLGGTGASAQSASSGPRQLTASRASGLDPDGQAVTVSGSGYDVEKGIYVALCVVPAPGGAPSPCGGGADLGGTTSASAWISSNPPSYGVGLAVPYGEGGTFSVSITVAALIGTTHDCRVVQCAIVSRSDHTRLTDRSQDVLIPVSFAQATPTATPTTPAATATATATAAPTTATPQPSASSTATPTTPAPTANPTPSATPMSPTGAATASPAASPAAAVSLSGDGRTASAGGRSITVSRVTSLAGDDRVTVSGTGFDTERGILVSLCAVPVAGRAPGPCAGGSPETSAWISSDPPGYGKDLARPFGEGGNFEVELVLSPVITTAVDCRKDACAIAARSDAQAPDDRSLDLLVPVSFAASSPEATPSVTSQGAPADSDGGAGWVVAGVLGGIALAGVLAAGAFLIRRRRAAVIAMVLLLALGLAACGSGSGDADPTPGAGAGVTVRSADGRDVTITDTSRVVSLWGNITEVLYDLGVGDRLVGRDVTSTYPDAATSLPEVTRGHDVSAEGVLSLRPTLVIGSKDNSGPTDALDQVRNVGIPVVLLADPAGVADIVPRIRSLAAIMGVHDAGEALAAKTQVELAAVASRIPATTAPPKVAFLYVRGQAGVYLIGGPGAGADSMIVAAGAIDAGSAMGLDRAFTPITSEALAVAAPDVILVTTTGLESVGGIDGLVKLPGVAQTPAGKARRIVTMDDELLYSFGPRTPEAVEQLSTKVFSSLAASR